ncbi:hypothetical protein B8W72_12625 [Pseudomonas putida]|uniref:Uncharacterized protein n=1 Tax=Pseudomonas putida TaxID=303 RepID=A0A1Y3L5L4_PSEPU|nr:hypothetical protein B8W72_12625 [Pseudomonas putida]
MRFVLRQHSCPGSILDFWGCCAALRGHARSHRDRVFFRRCAVPVGAGVPAKGRKAAPFVVT